MFEFVLYVFCLHDAKQHSFFVFSGFYNVFVNLFELPFAMTECKASPFCNFKCVFVNDFICVSVSSQFVHGRIASCLCLHDAL